MIRDGSRLIVKRRARITDHVAPENVAPETSVTLVRKMPPDRLSRCSRCRHRARSHATAHTRQEEQQNGEPDQQARLAVMIEEATVDAYGDSEQITGWYTMLEEHLALPIETAVLGIVVRVIALDLRGANTSSPSARAIANDSRSAFLICRFHRPGPHRGRIGRGVPSLGRGLITRPDRPLLGGHQSDGSWVGAGGR